MCPVRKGDKDIELVSYPCEFKATTDEYSVLFESQSVGTVTNKGSSKIREVGDRIGGLDCFDKSLWEMKKDQSRYTIGEILDVRVTTIKDIDVDDAFKMGISCPCESEILNHYNTVMKELNINRTYKYNDYVFLVEHTGLKNV